MQSAQSKILKAITGAPWYVRNDNIQRDLNILPARDEIQQTMERYYKKRPTHPNRLVRALTRGSNRSRLRRNDIPIQQ